MMGDHSNKTTSQIDLDSEIRYYLKILPQESISVHRMKNNNEIKRLYRFIQSVQRELQRRKFQADQAKAEYERSAFKLRRQNNSKQLWKKGRQQNQIANKFYTKITQGNNSFQTVAKHSQNGFNHNVHINIYENQQGQAKVQERNPFYSIITIEDSFTSESKYPKKINSGILNIGNSCYLNSALQCLYQTQYLNEQLKRKDGLFSDYLNKQFTRLYLSMCKRLEIQRLYNPSMIKKIIEKHNPIFQGDSQHDSGEVINTILNIIDQETNRVVKPKFIKVQYKQSDSDQSLCNKYSRKCRQRSYSLTDLIFSGFYRTAYHCNMCKRVKRLFQKFTVVYLPLTQQQTYLSKFSDCLKQFSSGQSIDWDCPKCQKETPHTKSMQIYRAGKTIVFCLKRFNEDNSKIKTPLEIPLKLNLDKQAHFVSQKNYILYAAIIHKGNHDYGHYVAYCYDYRAKCWTECDDSSVAVISEAELSTNIKDAYLLFYRLQKPQQQSAQMEDDAQIIEAE